MKDERKLPDTLDSAVDFLISSIDDNSRVLLMSIPQHGLVDFHHGWGTGIRNSFGLWSKTSKLLADCGCAEADDASMVIMKAVWNKLNGLPIDDARKKGNRYDWQCMKTAGPDAMYRRLRFRKNGKRFDDETIHRKMRFLFPMSLQEFQSLVARVDAEGDSP